MALYIYVDVLKMESTCQDSWDTSFGLNTPGLLLSDDFLANIARERLPSKSATVDTT